MTIKTSTTFSKDTSYLHIKDGRRSDVGNFRCIADNRVANPTSRDVLLIVKCKKDIVVFQLCFNGKVNIIIMKIHVEIPKISLGIPFRIFFNTNTISELFLMLSKSYELQCKINYT